MTLPIAPKLPDSHTDNWYDLSWSTDSIASKVASMFAWPFGSPERDAQSKRANDFHAFWDTVESIENPSQELLVTFCARYLESDNFIHCFPSPDVDIFESVVAFLHNKGMARDRLESFVQDFLNKKGIPGLIRATKLRKYRLIYRK